LRRDIQKIFDATEYREMGGGWRLADRISEYLRVGIGRRKPDFLPLFFHGGGEDRAKTRDFLDITPSFRDA
jgi:hypothetical protein